MKTTSAPSLADIELELPPRPVMDDLAAFANRLNLSAGPEKGYAAFAADNFQVAKIASRAIGYAVETTRFFALAGTSSKKPVVVFFDMLIALSLLHAMSTIAVALAPPRLSVDYAARRRIHADVIAAGGHDSGLKDLAGKAFRLEEAGASQEAEFTGGSAAAPRFEDLRHDRPLLVGLEQGLSLAAFLKELVAPGVLIARAALQLGDAGRFARTIEESDLGHERCDQLQRAVHGANLVAAADLARACVINAVGAGDPTMQVRIAEHVARLHDQRLRDIVTFAGVAADRLKERRRLQRETEGRSTPD